MSALSCAAQAAAVTYEVFTPTYANWSLSNNLVGLFNASKIATLSAQFGGSLTISNPSTITITITGGNGVGTWQNVALWTFDAPTGKTAVRTDDVTAMSLDEYVGIPYAVGFGNQASTGLPNLSITTQGFDLWTQRLGYTPLGVTAFTVVQNFGNITISNVPESSTYAMLFTGFMVVGTARRPMARH